MIECSGCGKSFNQMSLDGTRRQACPLCKAPIDQTSSVSKRDKSDITRSSFSSGLAGDAPPPVAPSPVAPPPVATASETQDTVFVASEVPDPVFGLWRDGKFMIVNSAQNQFPNRCLVSNTVVPVKAMRKHTFESTRAKNVLALLDRRPSSFTCRIALLQQHVPRYSGALKLTKWMAFAGPIILLSLARAMYTRNAKLTPDSAPVFSIGIMMTLMGIGSLLAIYIFKLEPIKVVAQRTVDGTEYYWISGVHPDLLDTFPQWGSN